MRNTAFFAILICWISSCTAGGETGAVHQGGKMANGFQLAWVEVGSSWIPSQPFPMRLRLTSSDRAEGIQLLEGPNPALGFALYREGETPTWHAGAEATAMAGIEGSQGMLANGTLGPGESWETSEDLNLYWLPPAPGRYLLSARYLTPGGAAETVARPIEVAPAGLAASDSALQKASEVLLAQAWGNASQLWLRLASGGFPLAPRWILPAGKWPGKGTIRVAQQAFSPLADPPLPSYRFWLVWLNGNRLAGCLLDHQGKSLARFEQTLRSVKGAELLTPVQMENAELFVPLAHRPAKGSELVWFRVTDSGGRAEEWGRWRLPQEAGRVMTAASPSGSVALVCLDSAQHTVSGSFGPLQPEAPALRVLSHFDQGKILFTTVLDTRQEMTLLLVRASENLRSVSVHQRGADTDLDAGPVAIPAELKPKDFSATWVHRAGAVLVMRDESDRLWVTSPGAGAQWKPVEGLRASYNFGVAGSLTGIVVWGADAVLGLRFQRAIMF